MKAHKTPPCLTCKLLRVQIDRWVKRFDLATRMAEKHPETRWDEEASYAAFRALEYSVALEAHKVSTHAG